MNRIYRTVWNVAKGQWQVAPETVKSQGKSRSRGTRTVGTVASLATGSFLLLPLHAFAGGLPSGGEVRAGEGSIEQSGSEMRINQKSDRMAIDWEDFSVDAGSRVEFIQPGRNSAALNRVTGDQVSRIRGAIEANGQVFLVNPNGIVFGDTAQVDVGGLVASTLDISPEDFMAGNFTFEGDSSSAIVNQGNIRTADEGYVALIAAEIINEGSIKAPKGDVLMGAGSRVTLDMGGPIKIEVEQARLDTYIEQGGAIKADGGRVYLTAKAAGDLAASVINHTGVTQAQTLAENEQGEIWLMGDMDSGETRVAGTLDASAPDGGDGGFIETSAAKVSIADEAVVTTKADNGQTGEWLIDPQDYTVAATDGDITGSSLSGLLDSNNITIQTVTGTDDTNNLYATQSGNGDIFVNDEVTWSSGNTLTLNAIRNIEINNTIDASEGSGGKLALEYGQGSADGEIDGQTASYAVNAPVNLQAGQNFSTQLGNTGDVLEFTVITELGTASGYDAGTLQAMRDDKSGNYALGTNINASETATWNQNGTDADGNPIYEGWDPIFDTSNFTNQFSGTFDGLGHTISNLTINRQNESYVGLFGRTKIGSSISNIGPVGGNVVGDRNVGGIVGVNASVIINSFAAINVTGRGDVGGLVGYNNNEITKAYAKGKVTATRGKAGGLVGWNQKPIANAYATGKVMGGSEVGGLVGQNFNGEITNTYATGNVEATGATSGYAGGLVGVNNGPGALVSDSYATGSVVTGSDVGGLIGLDFNSQNGAAGSYYAITDADGNGINSTNDSGKGIGLTRIELTKLSTFSAWGSDIDDQGGTGAVWRIYEGHTTPLLRSFLTPVTITPSVSDKTYDGSVASGSASYTLEPSNAMLEGGSQVDYTTDAADAGTYTTNSGLVFSGLYSDQQGYDIRYADAELAINPRPQLIPGALAESGPQPRITSIVSQTLQTASSPSEQDRSNRLTPTPPNPEMLLGGIQIMAGGINSTLNNNPEGDN
ncbi:MAG: filamentous hemagglutinin N-terminal domain-containing protein [Pseudomonadota bacterium]